MAEHNDKIELVKQAEIDAATTFSDIREGWDIDQVLYSNGWSWVKRFEVTNPETNETREVAKTFDLLGWTLVRNRETGRSAFVGITADTDFPAPYPACDAEGFEGYARCRAGTYIEGEDHADAANSAEVDRMLRK